jgi:hypothetical protein
MEKFTADMKAKAKELNQRLFRFEMTHPGKTKGDSVALRLPDDTASDEIWSWLKRTYGRLKGLPADPPMPWDMSGWSDEQILARGNELARNLYGLLGYTVKEGYRFDQATHSQEQMCWEMAVHVFTEFLGTELDAVAVQVADEAGELDEEDEPPKRRRRR